MAQAAKFKETLSSLETILKKLANPDEIEDSETKKLVKLISHFTKE